MRLRSVINGTDHPRLIFKVFPGTETLRDAVVGTCWKCSLAFSLTSSFVRVAHRVVMDRNLCVNHVYMM